MQFAYYTTYIAARTDNSPEKLAQVDKLFTNLQMEEEVFCDTIRIKRGNVKISR